MFSLTRFGFVACFAFALALVCSAEVIRLDVKNFEHLTQATSGATTGDWLIKFYAPWCGHCRKMEPAYEKVAEILDGEINVAKVDVPANRELGTRFDVKGFPTIKFLSQGKVYDYVGRCTTEDLVEFARGGYKIQPPQDVLPAMGMFGEISMVFKHAYKQAAKDLKNGKYLTIDVFLIAFVLMILLIPSPEYPKPTTPSNRRSTRDSETRPSDAAPPTSESDMPSKKSD